MSYSISTSLTRNLQEVFGENDPALRRAAVDELYLEDGVFYDPSKDVFAAATRSIASRVRSEPLILNFYISQLPSLRKWAMAGGSDGSRGVLAMHHMPGTDFIIARDGRIAAVYLFFDKLP